MGSLSFLLPSVPVCPCLGLQSQLLILSPPSSVQFPARPPLLFPAPLTTQWDPTPSMGSWGFLAPTVRRGNARKVGGGMSSGSPLNALSLDSELRFLLRASQLLCCEISFSMGA